jgi:hypothetical protein
VDLTLATLLSDRDRLLRTLARLADGASGITLPPTELMALRWRLATLDRLIARREAGELEQTPEA